MTFFGTQCRDVSSYFVTLCGALELEAVMCSHKVDCRLYFKYLTPTADPRRRSSASQRCISNVSLTLWRVSLIVTFKTNEQLTNLLHAVKFLQSLLCIPFAIKINLIVQQEPL